MLNQARPVRSLGAALRRHWVVALFAILATTGVGLGRALLAEPVYQASAKVLIADRDLASVVAGVNDASDTGQSVATEAQIAGLSSVAEAAKASLGDPASPLAKAATVDLRVVTTPNTSSESNVLSIEAESRDGDYARRLATAAAQQYVDFRKSIATREVRVAREELVTRVKELTESGRGAGQLYDELSGRLQQLDTLLILGSARATLLEGGGAAVQVEPQPVRSTVLGFGTGFLVACIVVLILDVVDSRVHGGAEIEEILAAPVLAHLPNPANKDGLPSTPVASDPNGPAAEAFRGLRQHVKLGLSSRRARSLLVLSAQTGEGKSYVVTNLALAAAAAGEDVVVVDLDLRRPSLARYFGLGDGPGFADLVAGDITLDEALVPVPLPLSASGRGQLRVMRAGRRVPSPGEFVASQGVQEELQRIVGLGTGIVIIDTPPLVPVNDATALAEHVDASIIVVDMRQTRRRLLGRLRGLIDAGAHRPLGVVLTSSWTRQTGPGYGYGYGSPDEIASPITHRTEKRQEA